MAINPNHCKEHKWCFANAIPTTGFALPNYIIVLFCQKCAKLKKQKLKINK